MVTIYVDMVGDLFHIGHINIFKKAKEHGTKLIVGVHSDKDVESYKRKPIINENDRYSIIQECKLVDKLIKNAPLQITEEYLNENSIDLVIHGDDVYDSNGNIKETYLEMYKVPIKLGKMKFISYTKGISTTELIRKIKER